MTANEFSRYASKRRTAEAHPCVFRSTVNAAKTRKRRPYLLRLE